MKSKTKVLIINGPPNSGKDELANILVLRYGYVRKREFKEKLFELVKSIYSVSDKVFNDIYTDRTKKEIGNPIFDGLSVRAAMIKVSEQVIKPVYGNQYFGRAAARMLVEGSLNVFSDGGFEDENIPLIEKVGIENFKIIRLERDGCNFDNDSRCYLPNHDYLIKNNGSMKDLHKKGYDLVESFYE